MSPSDRTRPAGATVVAVFTALALLIAPVCAPLCAASHCSSSAHQEPCHETVSSGADGVAQFVAPSNVCGTSDFSAVLIKVDEKYLLSQTGPGSTPPALVHHSPELTRENFPLSPQLWGGRRVPLETEDSPLQSTILRI
jgi:hypothetical protein